MDNQEISFKQNYDLHNVVIIRNNEILLKYTDRVPIDFETLLDYVKNKQSKFIEILDGITIKLKIDKRKFILIHKTLFDKVVDLSVVSGNIRIQEFMTLPINVVYSIICQYN